MKLVNTRCSAFLVFLLGALLGNEGLAGSLWARDPRLRHSLGPRAVDVIFEAERVEAVRLDPGRHAGDPEVPTTTERVGGFPVIGEWRPVPDSLVSHFKDSLLDPTTFSFPPPGVGIGKLCGGFQPGVALRFWPKSKKGSSAVDVLLCFRCRDLAIAEARQKKHRPLVDMAPGASNLMGLASAALPDFRELREEVARSQDRRGRALLFASMFPAHVQLAMRSPWVTSRGDGPDLTESRRATPVLLAHASGKDLFVLAARALGIKGNDWSGDDEETLTLYDSMRTLSEAEVSAGLDAIRLDQTALAGAGELLFRAQVAEKLSASARQRWLPLVTEAVLIRQPHDDICRMLKSYATLLGKSGVPLLLRLSRGQLPVALGVQERASGQEASAAACGLMALVEADHTIAAAESRAWHPTLPVDARAARAVRARLGDESALDASLFDGESVSIGRLAVAAIRAHPSAAAMDLLVGTAIDHRYGHVRSDAESVFSLVAGVAIPSDRRTTEERAAFVRDWWRDNRASWTARKDLPPPK